MSWLSKLQAKPSFFWVQAMSFCAGAAFFSGVHDLIHRSSELGWVAAFLVSFTSLRWSVLMADRLNSGKTS